MSVNANNAYAYSQLMQVPLVARADGIDRRHSFDDQAIEDAAHIMEGKKVRRLTVMKHEKRMVGFLSVDDLAHWAHALSGEVLDEVTAH